MNSTDNRPRSVLECVRPDGALDARKFAAYQQRQGDETLARLRAAVERVDEAAEVPPSRKRSRSSIGGLSYVEIETGRTVKLEPTESTWYKLYVSNRGVWLLVDNGYLEHSTLLPPMKITTTQAETRWSKWVESMRKDVECTFGILKGRCVRACCFPVYVSVSHASCT